MSAPGEGGRLFGLGLSRTGTLSLARALEILGFRTAHYPHDPETFRALRTGTYQLPVLESHDALVDIVAAPYYDQFDNLYPGSKFILTVRDLESWLRSVEAHFERLEEHWEETSPSFRGLTRFLCAAIYGTHTFARDRFIHVHEQHSRNVREYFVDRPEDLLVLDVPGGDGWEELCSFLELPQPEVPFPHENRAGETPEGEPGSDGSERPPAPDYPASYHREVATSARPSARAVAPHLANLLSPESVVDVGCGLGGWLAAFRELGVDDVVGVDQHPGRSDALEIPGDRYRRHDLTRPLRLGRTFDVALCLEVAEHLPEEAAGRLVDDLVSLAPVAVFAAAVPGQGGRGHLNERWPEYWADLFSERDRVVVDALRPRLWNDGEVEWWYRQNLLLFVDRELLETSPRLRSAREETREGQLSVVHPALYGRTVEERDGCIGELWDRRARSVRDLIEEHVPDGSTCLLADDGKLGPMDARDRTVLPFPARDGAFAGPPADGAEAVRELERQRREGAEHLVVAWPAFWWLDHYDELRHYLDSETQWIHEGEDAVLVGFGS